MADQGQAKVVGGVDKEGLHPRATDGPAVVVLDQGVPVMTAATSSGMSWSELCTGAVVVQGNLQRTC
jgi:hypothetical protein